MTGVAVLGVAALGLLAATLATAREHDRPVGGVGSYLDGWSALHGDHDPRGSRWTRGWLALVHRLAKPLAARGVAPDVLTAWTVWLAAAVLVAASAGGRWLLLAGVLVVLGGLADGLDGAVAVLTGRATRWGHVADSLADRVSDVAYVAAVWLVGGQAWAALAAIAAFSALEYTRARAGSAGMAEIGVVTVGERPTRVILCAVGLVAAGALLERAAVLATAALVVLTALSTAGLVQLLVVVRRRLA